MAWSYKEFQTSAATNAAKAQMDANQTYKQSAELQGLKKTLDTTNANKVSLNDWNGGTYGQKVKDTASAIENRKPFTYDFNADTLYQQYKDRYILGGRMAMMDTLGQTTALTGGYGNSYAATAGNQAYQGYLTNLNDMMPQLYQLAYNKYRDEGQDLKDQLGMYQGLYNTEYGEFGDRVNQWERDYDRANSAYQTQYDRELNQFNTNRSYYTNLYNQLYGNDRGAYESDRNSAFGAYQQEVSERQWAEEQEIRQQQLAIQQAAQDLAERQFAASRDDAEWQRQQAEAAAAARASSGGSSGGSGGSKTPTPTPEPQKDEKSGWTVQQWAHYLSGIAAGSGYNAAVSEMNSAPDAYKTALYSGLEHYRRGK